jgi:subtilisin family serine protease
MRARVTTNLNVRARVPRVLPDNNPGYLAPNTVVEIDDVVTGDDYKGNNIWYRLTDGTYIWSGGVSEKIRKTGNVIAPELTREVVYNLDWWHTTFGICDIWEKYDTKGGGVEVAILDSGIAPQVPGKMYGNFFDYDNISGIGINGSAVYNDTAGHGTMIASIIAGNGDMLGVAPDCKLFACRYYEKDPDVEALIKGIGQIPERIGFVVISSSFLRDNVSEDQQARLQTAIQSLATRALIFCSVGDDFNHYDSPYNRLPAAFRDFTLGVASVGGQRTASKFSTRSNCIALAAPGENMRAVDFKRDGIYPVNGTSFSTPFVAAVCALAKAAKPALTLQQIKTALVASLDPAGDPQLYGSGIINPLGMFERLFYEAI